MVWLERSRKIMAGYQDDPCCSGGQALNTPSWRRALWVALTLNGVMFLAEIGTGVAAGSASLQADALDFLGDTANYAISLGVAGMVLVVRARVALLKGVTLFALALWVIGITGFHAYYGTLPKAEIMGVVGLLALLTNLGVAVMLFRFRGGDANMRSVWICSRNDAIGNLSVLGAAAGVFGTGTGWPDIVVAAIMAALGISGGWQIMRQASSELHHTGAAALPPSWTGR
jgi:Co/Zn/Cd efflux system component